MHENHKITVKPLKEVDAFDRVLRFKAFFRIFAPSFILFSLLFGPVIGLLAALAVGGIGSIIVMYFADTLGSDVAKLIFGGRRANIPLRELLESELKAAKVAKMNKEFKTAIDMVNSILERDPEFYEAVFVKAQILDEGFDKTASALKYAQRVIENTQKGESLNNWAVSFCKTLSER